MSLPKWATTVTPLSKILAMIIFITLPILAFFVGMKYQGTGEAKKIGDNSAAIISAIPAKQLPTISKNKIYLVKNYENEQVNIFADLPDGSDVKYNNDSQTKGYMNADVTIGNQEYVFSVQSGGRGGPCPMEDNDPSHCGYIDQNINTLKGVKIEAVRIWKDDPRGVFLLNPWSIEAEGKYYINSVLVTKKTENKGFDQSEVETWLKIFSSINFEKI